jgi:cytochrome c oxidase subunit II
METPKYGYWMPPDWSLSGHTIDRLIIIVHYFMAALFIGWGIFLIYCMIKFRRRAGHKASYESSTSKLPKYAELAVVIFEVFLLVGLSFPVWSKYKSDFPDKKDALSVRVVAQQFVWNFQYSGPDGKFGRSDPKLITDSNPLGIDASDPASADDVVTLNQFHFPVHKPVIAHITSKDVIHSFGVPVLRLKQDAVPGMSVPIHFEAIQTGTFEIACSQLCGVGHSLMKGIVTVQSPEDFEKWYQEQPKPFQAKK